MACSRPLMTCPSSSFSRHAKKHSLSCSSSFSRSLALSPLMYGTVL